MKILLDEQVPQPVLEPLARLLRPKHTIDHVQGIGWKRKKDANLIPDLAARGYEILVTADLNQLVREEESKLIRKHGFHHVRFQQIGSGISAMASAMATIIAGLTAVLPELEQADSQRLVLLKAVRSNSDQFVIVDPRISPPTYWPGRGTGSNRSTMNAAPNPRGKRRSQKPSESH